MRLIKLFLSGLIGLFIFITLLSLLIPAHPRVTRTVVIHTADTKKIMQQVSDLHLWKNWQPMFAADTTAIKYGTTGSGEGATCSIRISNRVTIVTINKVDTAALSFTLHTDGENDISNRIVATSMHPVQQTKVDWIATANLSWYPWQKFYAIFMDKLTGPGYEASLNGLKQYIESH